MYNSEAQPTSIFDERFSRKIRTNKHPKRKNNIKVAAMYEMYKKGPDGKPKSLEEVGEYYGITRQAVYDLFSTRGYPLRSKPMKGLTVIDGYKFTENKQGYLRGTVEGKRVMAHRWIWEKNNGPVPKGYVLHFKDGNKKNVNIKNLELVAKKDMQKKFNPKGINQHTKGRSK